ncbi:MAG: hypothetical protein IT555_04940 [Acetobacteraceae bacterium]|nr:hypothetical protein [Acetobacteraceae bacterium]
MTILPELRARVPSDPGSENPPPPDDAEILWHHPAFCPIALPAEPGGAGAWHRSLGGTSVSIEPATERDRLPGGAMLRRLLMHLCDSAVRDGQSQVMLGENAAALAAAMNPPVTGPAIAALEAQVAAVLACRIVVATEDGPGLSVLDARGRPRAVAAEWRPVLRLNARFLDNLQRDKVALDRAVIAALQESALALDIYTWLAATLPGQVGQTVLAESWPELQTRFGAEGQDGEAFQAGFTAALALLRNALPGLDADDDAIGVGFSARAATPAEPPPPPPPPPEPKRSPTRLGLNPPPPEPPPPPPVARPIRPPPPPTPAEQYEPLAPGQTLRPTISLKSHITGLQQVVWLQRANGRDNVVIEVTPGSRYDPAVVTVLALEPIVLQVAGGLHGRDFERVATWATANRDLIDAFWDGLVDGFDDIMSRVKKVPAPGADRYR